MLWIPVSFRICVTSRAPWDFLRSCQPASLHDLSSALEVFFFFFNFNNEKILKQSQKYNKGSSTVPEKMRVFKYEVRLLLWCPSLPNTRVCLSYRQNILQQNHNAMYPFPRAVITDYHKLESLKQQKFIFSLLGGRKSEIKVSAELCFLWRLQG